MLTKYIESELALLDYDRKDVVKEYFIYLSENNQIVAFYGRDIPTKRTKEILNDVNDYEVWLIDRMERGKPLSELTLKEDEWSDLGKIYLNKRYACIQKVGVNGRPFYRGACCLVDVDGFRDRAQPILYTSDTKRVYNIGRCYIKSNSDFPVVDVKCKHYFVTINDGVEERVFDYCITTQKEVDKLLKYYDVKFKRITDLLAKYLIK